MLLFKKISESFWVSPQLQEADFSEAAALGVALVINNRPDGESGDQLPSLIAQQAAQALGMGYRHIPITTPTDQAVAAMAEALASQSGPVLAYCRSGTRSTTLWALAAARTGQDPQTLVEAAADAGYDLRSLKPALHNAYSRAQENKSG